MFYVNTTDGMTFKGPLEKLEEWRNVARKKKITPVTRDNNTTAFPKGADAGALAAYQKIISNNSMVEPLVHVHQIMSSPAVTIQPDALLTDAWLLLQELSIRQVVVATEKREIIGILSDRDILRWINIAGNKMVVDQELLVDDVTDKEFVSTDSISDIRRVARVLAHFHIDAMPVLTDERLVGIVTRGDILRGFAANPKLNLWA